MKAKPSNLKPEVHEEQRLVLLLGIESWEEDSFTVPVSALNVVVAKPDLSWDDI